MARKTPCLKPIRAVSNKLIWDNHRMITIGRIPTCLRSLFGPQRRHYSKRAGPHFRRLVMGIAKGTGHTIERPNVLLRATVEIVFPSRDRKGAVDAKSHLPFWQRH